jgi:hypothetical protein
MASNILIAFDIKFPPDLRGDIIWAAMEQTSEFRAEGAKVIDSVDDIEAYRTEAGIEPGKKMYNSQWTEWANRAGTGVDPVWLTPRYLGLVIVPLQPDRLVIGKGNYNLLNSFKAAGKQLWIYANGKLNEIVGVEALTGGGYTEAARLII